MPQLGTPAFEGVHAVGVASGHAGDDFHAGEAGARGVGHGGDHLLAQG